MPKEKKLSRTKAAADNIADMPKETAGQRVKYLLKKNGMTQKELAKKMYGDEVTEAQIINLNAKINGSGQRRITPNDAQLMSEIFNVFSQFILEGGYENNTDILRDSINKMNEEGQLLNTAFMSLAALAGYKVKRLGYYGETAEEVVKSLYDYVEIEYNDKLISLTQKQLNQLENIIYEHAEITIKQYLKGVDINGKHTREKK